MAIAFRAAATLDVPADDTTWDVPVPSGTVDGDQLYAFLVCSTTTPTCATPAGWTIVGTTQVSGGSDSRGYLFRRVAASQGATVTFTWSGGTTRSGAACMVAYSGHGGHDGGSGGTFASTTTPAAPAITPTADNCLVIGFWGTDQAAAGVTWTPPTGYTERVDFQDSGPFCTIHVAEKQQTTAGAETPTATVSTADEGVAFSAALKTAAVVGATARAYAMVIGGG